MKTVWFRVECNAHIGMGHISRCLTLAMQLQRCGIKIGVMASAATLHIMKRYLRNAHWEVLPSFINECQDAAASVAILCRVPCDMLVVDCYALSRCWETEVRPYAGQLMVIDDLASPHDCDILLDQNYHPGSSRYNGKVPHDAVKLLGPRYALLREKVGRPMPAEENTRFPEKKRLFVCFGGSDPVCATSLVVKALLEIKSSLSGCDIVVGAHYPDNARLKELCSSLPGAILHINHPAPEQLMHGAHLAIGGGGVMMWERAAAGIPSLVISIVNNQLDGCIAMEKAGLIEYLGHYDRVDAAQVSQCVSNALKEYRTRYNMAQKAQTVVDGQGAKRVVRKMLYV